MIKLMSKSAKVVNVITVSFFCWLSVSSALHSDPRDYVFVDPTRKLLAEKLLGELKGAALGGGDDRFDPSGQVVVARLGNLELLALLLSDDYVVRPQSTTIPRYPDEALARTGYPEGIQRVDLFIRLAEGAGEKANLVCSVSAQDPSGKTTQLKNGSCLDFSFNKAGGKFRLSPFIVRFRNQAEDEDGKWKIIVTVTNVSSAISETLQLEYELITEPLSIE